MENPVKKPTMADYNSTQQIRTKPYNRDRSNQTRRRRTDKVDLSVYEIPIVESRSMLIFLSILPVTVYRPFHQLFTGSEMAGGPKY